MSSEARIMNLSIKERNAYYEKLMLWLDYYKDTRCGMSRACGGGWGCNCDHDERIPVFELDYCDMDRFIEFILGEETT